jgi:TatD DNase family protein
MGLNGIIDTHVQLYFRDFDADRAAVIEQAQQAGVTGQIQIGCDWQTSLQALALAEAQGDMAATAGVHPHYAAAATAKDLEAFEQLFREHRVVAVGEVGLDYYRNLSSPAVQQTVVRHFIQAALRHNLPLVFHCRDAFDDLIAILEGFGRTAALRGVMHCFSGDRRHLERCLALGLHISFAGPLTYPKNEELRAACRLCPPDRLLVETDAPYLPPQAKRGRRNEPAYVVDVVRLVAELKSMPVAELIERTRRNALELFNLPEHFGRGAYAHAGSH